MTDLTPTLTTLLENFAGQSTLLESLFNSMTDMLFYIKDGDARYLSVNDTLVRRSGLSREHVIGKTGDQIFPSFGLSSYAHDKLVMSTQRPVVNRLRLYTIAGRRYWCLSTKYPIIGSCGETVGLIGISKDLPFAAERHESYKFLHAYTEKLESSGGMNMSVSEGAAGAGISLGTLERVTREVFALTPKQLSVKIRIEHACVLLDTTTLSITNIASSCGYADHSAFTRQFKSATHIKPMQYRARNLLL
ncbi:transcriptional regulator [Pseudomonas amygdali pv. eriobotryae]|uniref:helix-turn-helix domain-containing protein n=3 Tax=Pseudomonas amygdali TaxID=47877 RepID=UPI0007090FDF|nr:helix-turn-helix domain-containing protein [Pseudomonas amygdali]KWS78382.1 AraC family transcriptional regulator [Pseudomonas amygdali pv. eriobotryae]GFZ73883.1 transcriptional regulator [Pseudomonas amygdali pv. eriobotryae]